MKTPPVSLDRPVLGATINGYAKMINQTAIESKEFALELLDMGIRKNVTPKFLRTEFPDTFAKNGKLKKTAREELAIFLKKCNLKQNTKLEDIKDFIVEAMQSKKSKEVFEQTPDAYFDLVCENTSKGIYI